MRFIKPPLPVGSLPIKQVSVAIPAVALIALLAACSGGGLPGGGSGEVPKSLNCPALAELDIRPLVGVVSDSFGTNTEATYCTVEGAGGNIRVSVGEQQPADPKGYFDAYAAFETSFSFCVDESWRESDTEGKIPSSWPDCPPGQRHSGKEIPMSAYYPDAKLADVSPEGIEDLTMRAQAAVLQNEDGLKESEDDILRFQRDEVARGKARIKGLQAWKPGQPLPPETMGVVDNVHFIGASKFKAINPKGWSYGIVWRSRPSSPNTPPEYDLMLVQSNGQTFRCSVNIEEPDPTPESLESKLPEVVKYCDAVLDKARG